MISVVLCKFLYFGVRYIVMSFFSLDPQTNKYDPRDKVWLKEKIFLHLKSQSA